MARCSPAQRPSPWILGLDRRLRPLCGVSIAKGSSALAGIPGVGAARGLRYGAPPAFVWQSSDGKHRQRSATIQSTRVASDSVRPAARGPGRAQIINVSIKGQAEQPAPDRSVRVKGFVRAHRQRMALGPLISREVGFLRSPARCSAPSHLAVDDAEQRWIAEVGNQDLPGPVWCVFPDPEVAVYVCDDLAAFLTTLREHTSQGEMHTWLNGAEQSFHCGTENSRRNIQDSK